MENRRTVIHKLDIAPGKVEFLKERPSVIRSIIKDLKKEGFVVSFDLNRLQVTVETGSNRDTEDAVQFIDDLIVEREVPENEMMVRKDTARQTVKVFTLQQSKENYNYNKNIDVKDPSFWRDPKEDERRRTVATDILYDRNENAPSDLCRDPKEDERRRSVETDILYDRKKNAPSDLGACARPAATVDPQKSGMRKSTFYCKVGTMMDELPTIASDVGNKYNCDVQHTRTGPTPVVTNQASVTVLFGEIQTTEADVIVNSTNSKLNLAVAKGLSTVLLKAAGDSIQTELHTNNKNELQYGEVTKSGSGNISTCKAIYHGVLRMFLKDKNKEACYEDLVSVILKTLLMASSDGYRSIAFPALGAGNLGYPVQEVVQLMFTTVSQFFECVVSPIQKVLFVIYPKADTKQLFLMEHFSYQFHTVKVDRPSTAHEELTKEPAEMCETRFKIGTTFLQLSNGDIRSFRDVANVILILWREDYLSRTKENPVVSCFDGSVQAALYSNYVPRLKQKLTKVEVDNTSFSKTRLVHLYCKDDTDDAIARAITRGIKHIKEDVTTIALPIHSDGSRPWQPQIAAKIITKALKKVKSSHPVVQVILQDSVYLEQFLRSLLGAHKVHEVPNVTHIFDNFFPLPGSHAMIGDVIITVTPQSGETTDESVKKVAMELKKLLGITLMWKS